MRTSLPPATLNGADSFPIAAAELHAPTVVHAINDRLDPLLASKGATVRVGYRPMVSTDIIDIAWTGSDLSLTGYGSDTAESVDFVVPVSVVAASLGKTVSVYYTVVRNGMRRVSNTLSLTVQPIPLSSLPKPYIPEADAQDVLDLSRFAGDASVWIAPWPLISVGQRVELRLTGTAKDGAPLNVPLLLAHLATQPDVGSGITQTIPRIELDKFESGTVTIVADVIPGGYSPDAYRMRLRTRTLNAKQPLHVDNTLLELAGISVKVGWPKTGLDAEGNTAVRLATGGVPPYTFTSQNIDVASVSTVGLVTGESIGSTTVNISDATGSTVSYPVRVTHVFTLSDDPTKKNYQQAVAWMDALGGIPVSLAAFRAIRRVYKIPGEARWLCTLEVCPAGSGGYWNPGSDTYGCKSLNANLGSLCLHEKIE